MSFGYSAGLKIGFLRFGKCRNCGDPVKRLGARLCSTVLVGCRAWHEAPIRGEQGVLGLWSGVVAGVSEAASLATAPQQSAWSRRYRKQ